MSRIENCGIDLVRSKWSYLLWGVPVLLLGVGTWVGGPLRAVSWPLSFAVMGGACRANARGCKRTHCHATGPLYLLAAAASLASPWWSALPALYVWIGATTALGTLAAYGWEWSHGEYLEPPIR